MNCRDTRYEIDLDCLARNCREVLKLLGTPVPGEATPPPPGPFRRPLLAAVVKADAYGLGAVTVAGTLLAAGADLLAVACLPEAIELRRHWPAARIMVMGHTPDRLLPELLTHSLTGTIFDLAQARMLSEAASAAGRKAVIHLKVDTGMNRLGLKPGPETPELLAAMAALPGLEFEGIFTHLALCDREGDEAQYALFEEVLAIAALAGLRFRLRHVCDSIGMVRYPQWRLDLVRAGAILFGAPPLDLLAGTGPEISAPFALRTRVSRLRRLRPGEGVGYDYTWRAPAPGQRRPDDPGGALLATLPIGYGDGYRRCLSNTAEVLVRGTRAPVVGLVNMDQCAVDVTAVPGAAEGDDVLLLGAGPEGEIPVLELAKKAGTNRNEILAAIGRRVPRLYFEKGRLVGVLDYLLG